MRRPALTSLLVAVGILLAYAAPVLAATGDDGEGWFGESDDRIITFFSLGLIIFFPLVVTIGTLLQSALERRKEARKAARMRGRVGW